MKNNNITSLTIDDVNNAEWTGTVSQFGKHIIIEFLKRALLSGIEKTERISKLEKELRELKNSSVSNN